MNRHEEALLREYIRQNLSDRALLNEGVKDVLKKTLKAALTKIQELIDKLKSSAAASNRVMDALEKSGSGDVITKVETIGQEFESSINDAANAVPSKMGETRHFSHRPYKRNKQLSLNEELRSRRALNEIVFGGFEIIGVSLAVLGGLPLLLKVLKKLAGFLGFEDAADKLGAAYEKAHHFEEMVIDYAIPDKALYAVYLAIQEEKNPEEFANLKIHQTDSSEISGKTIKSTHKRTRDETGERTGKFKRTISGRGLKRTMTFEEFVESQEKQKYEKRTWAIVLIPWLISGLLSLHHMFTGILGAIEGAATGVKAIEVGSAAREVAPSIAAEIGSAISALAKA